MTKQPIIQFKNVHKSFGEGIHAKHVLKDVDLAVEEVFINRLQETADAFLGRVAQERVGANAFVLRHEKLGDLGQAEAGITGPLPEIEPFGIGCAVIKSNINLNKRRAV